MRAIKEGDAFFECVTRLGGYRAIDQALEPLLDGLMRNPFGFPAIETDFTQLVRYARTKMISDQVPSLIFAFTIDENKDVILQWVDEEFPF